MTGNTTGNSYDEHFFQTFQTQVTGGISLWKSQLYGTSGASLRPIAVDTATNTIQNIAYEHHEIHSGSHFHICDFDDSIAVNETITFVVTTPNTTKWAHMDLQFASILGAKLEVYEGASAVVGGTPVVPFNNDRNSSTASVLTIIKDPTSVTDGTRIGGYLAGANRVAGYTDRDKEIILKQNTTYVFRFTSLANSNAISFCGEWYEHINKTE